MSAIVEIEWPLAGGSNVAKTFFPVVRVYDGAGGPAADHKVFFELTKGTSTFTAVTGLLDPALDKTYSSTSITTTEVGAHKLVAILKDVSVVPAVEIDRDEEDGIVVAVAGQTKREFKFIVIEE